MKQMIKWERQHFLGTHLLRSIYGVDTTSSYTIFHTDHREHTLKPTGKTAGHKGLDCFWEFWSRWKNLNTETDSNEKPNALVHILNWTEKKVDLTEEELRIYISSLIKYNLLPDMDIEWVIKNEAIMLFDIDKIPPARFYGWFCNSRTITGNPNIVRTVAHLIKEYDIHPLTAIVFSITKSLGDRGHHYAETWFAKNKTTEKWDDNTACGNIYRAHKVFTGDYKVGQSMLSYYKNGSEPPQYGFNSELRKTKMPSASTLSKIGDPFKFRPEMW